MFYDERALFSESDISIRNCVFDKGESPLKECKNVKADTCFFRWKYPLWYCNNVKVKKTNWFSGARAGVWYTDNIELENCIIEAVKNFRRCNNIKLKDVTFTDAQETFWSCKNAELDYVTVKGDYFAMNCENIKCDHLRVDGNYCFDGAKNIEIKDSVLLTKDAFWNSENVTVKDSFVVGEYLGWNSKNLTLINCKLESLQGLCYIENLKLINCELINTTLAFEYSTVEADIKGKIDSVLNPTSGTIKADKIGELIIQKDYADAEKTKIICKDIEKIGDAPTFEI